jgi:hypothetical protein
MAAQPQPYAGPAVAPNALPALVRYWFVYCAQYNNTAGGNIAALFQNGFALPLDPPIIGGLPQSHPAPFNGPFLISCPKLDHRPKQQRHPSRQGAGVFLGFQIDNGNNPMQWSCCYGRISKAKRRLGKGKLPKPQLRIYARPVNFTNQPITGAKTVRVNLQQVSTIQALRGQSDAQIEAYVALGQVIDTVNHPGDYNVQLKHLRMLQNAPRSHITTATSASTSESIWNLRRGVVIRGGREEEDEEKNEGLEE